MNTELKPTFHKHEVVGAAMTKRCLNRLGFSAPIQNRVYSLVRNHQIRFYENTKDSTKAKWFRNLSLLEPKDALYGLIIVLIADRVSNPTKRSLPAITPETLALANFPAKYQSVSDFKKLLVKQNKKGTYLIDENHGTSFLNVFIALSSLEEKQKLLNDIYQQLDSKSGNK